MRRFSSFSRGFFAFGQSACRLESKAKDLESPRRRNSSSHGIRVAFEGSLSRTTEPAPPSKNPKPDPGVSQWPRTQLAPFAVRRSRIALLLAPVLVLADRRRLRPSADVDAARLRRPRSSSAPPSSPRPCPERRPITTEPDAIRADPDPDPLAPSTGSTDGVIRTSGSPPVPPEAEPPLNSRARRPPDSSPNAHRRDRAEPGRAPSGAPAGRPAPRPGALGSRSARRSRPFVAEPDDLFQPPKADRPWKYVVVHHSANATGGLRPDRPRPPQDPRLRRAAATTS